MSIKLLIITSSLVILSFICNNAFAVEPDPASLSDGNTTGQPANITAEPVYQYPQEYPFYQDQNQCFQVDSKAQPPLGMRIAADKGEYQPGQRITLFVDVLDSAGCNIPVLVKVDLAKIGQDASLKDSQYYYASGYPPYTAIVQDTGKYVINVSLVSTSLNEGKSLEASTIFNSVNFYETTSARIVLVAIVSFAGLMVVTGLSDKHKHQDGFEILRFVFISGIIFSVIGSFVFLVDEVGTNSPVGLIRTNPANGYGALNGEWVINIGGDIRGPFTQDENAIGGDIRGPFTQDQKAIGIQIPLYVVIFGIMGGYLRYLYSKALPILTNIKTSKKYENNPNVKKEIGIQSQTLHSFYLSLGEIALLFLAPVLAVATYFILTIFGMSGPNSVYTIGALSIAIGLVTKEVIDVIIKFAKSKLGQAEDEIKNTKDKQDIPDETTTPDTETKPDETTTPDTETKPDETTTPEATKP